MVIWRFISLFQKCFECLLKVLVHAREIEKIIRYLLSCNRLKNNQLSEEIQTRTKEYPFCTDVLVVL